MLVRQVQSKKTPITYVRGVSASGSDALVLIDDCVDVVAASAANCDVDEVVLGVVEG